MANVVARILCVDKRYSRAEVLKFLEETLGETYHLTVPGASLALVDSDVLRQAVFQEIDILAKAGIVFDGVQIIDHFDASGHHGCKAYGENDSREKHEANLRRALTVLRHHRLLQGAEITLVLHDIDARKIETVGHREKAIAQ